MTRITNLVARKRKFIAEEEAPREPSSSAGALESRTKRTKVPGKDGSGYLERHERTYDSKRPRQPTDRAAASEQRRQRRIDERNAETTCFACRQRGHAARDCPSAVSVGEGKSIVGICYRCGSDRHSLKRCRKPADPSNPLPFASCFVCSGKGHLSGSCPSNSKGLYPDGGCCKLCGQNDHLAKDCAIRSAAPTSNAFLGITEVSGADVGADEDDFHILKRRTTQIASEEKIEHRASEIISRKPLDRRPPIPAAGVSPAVVAAPKKAKIVTF